MSRYETILYTLRDRVTAEMTPEDLERLAEPLQRLNETERATARAYKICGCGAEYTEVQWARLLPVRPDRWELDPYTREEWRECSNCSGWLAILESNGERRPIDTVAVKAIAAAHHACGRCLNQIEPGTWYVERWERRHGKSGIRALGRWAFCSKKCEAL